MRLLPRLSAPLIGLLAVLAFAGCDTAEERAEAHYQRGMELLQAGDVDRAMVEFRNVFQLNGDHTSARLAYARILRDRGETREAYGQYLRLVEQDPSSLEGRIEVAKLALETRNLTDAETHIDAAYKLAPQNREVRALKATVDYATGDRPAALAMAKQVLAEDPTQVPAHMIVIADKINAGDYAAALPLIEAAIAQAPEDEGLHVVKLSTLEKLGDTAAMGDELKLMVATFPENDSFQQALVRWHLSQGDTDGAEAVQRQLAARTPGDPEANYRVVQLILQSKGADAARAELRRLIATGDNVLPYRRALAVLDFSAGNTEGGIAALRQLIDTSEPSDERRDTQAVLAQMLGRTGDVAGRDALVDAVLAEDATHVEALKLRARREIDADQPERAIQDMRTALEKAPRDADILTLMAEGHEREGARELAGERLALAVEVSDKRPAESIRYARFLMQDDRFGPAESVIVDALKLRPNDRDLLLTLGQIHLQRRDWDRAKQVADLLRAQKDPAATRMADGIEATALRGQDKLDETVTMLRGLVDENDQDTRALAGLVQTYVEAGEIDTARTYVGERLDKDPKSVPLRMMQAGLDTVSGDTEAAKALYREIIAEQPDYAQSYRALFGILNLEGRQDAAATLLDAGIAATDDGGLLFTKASLLERREDFDGAIAIYEDLYARDSGTDVVANNLASLLTTHRSDEASLERAFTIARRLRASDVPYYQDTYGWILTRRGDPEQALSFLESAGRGLPDNELVQVHLGLTYAALDRGDAARTALEKALALAGPDSAVPEIAQARAKLAELDAPAAAPSE